MKKEFEVYAIKKENTTLKAVLTEDNDVITSEKMKSYIKVDGITFYVNLNGKKINFVFNDEGELSSPDPSKLKQIKNF